MAEHRLQVLGSGIIVCVECGLHGCECDREAIQETPCEGHKPVYEDTFYKEDE